MRKWEPTSSLRCFIVCQQSVTLLISILLKSSSIERRNNGNKVNFDFRRLYLFDMKRIQSVFTSSPPTAHTPTVKSKIMDWLWHWRVVKPNTPRTVSSMEANTVADTRHEFWCAKMLANIGQVERWGCDCSLPSTWLLRKHGETINGINECLLIRVICCERWMKASFSSFNSRYIVEQVSSEWLQQLPLPGSNYISILCSGLSCAIIKSALFEGVRCAPVRWFSLWPYCVKFNATVKWENVRVSSIRLAFLCILRCAILWRTQKFPYRFYN